MKAPYMRIVFLPEIFTKVYANIEIGQVKLLYETIEFDKVVAFFVLVDNRISVRVSAQIFSTKREYCYFAKFIKNKAKALEDQYDN